MGKNNINLKEQFSNEAFLGVGYFELQIFNCTKKCNDKITFDAPSEKRRLFDDFLGIRRCNVTSILVTLGVRTFCAWWFLIFKQQH